MKNKYVAAVLAFFGGMIGAHKFYLNDPGSGIFYLFLTMVTGARIPFAAILGVIDGIRYITMGDEEFDRKFNRRRTTRKRVPLPPKMKKPRRSKEYYDYQRHDNNKRKPQAQRNERLRSNPFKKSGFKKYRDYDIEEAIVDFEKALKIQPNDESIHFHLACAYSLLENKDKAFHHISIAVQNGFTDFKKIQSHDDLAYMRIQPEYETFKSTGYKATKSPQEELAEINDELLLDKLAKLVEMRKRGIVTEKDFKVEREKILRKA